MKVPLIALDQLTAEKPQEVNFFGRNILVVQTEDRPQAYVNICPHAGGPLTFEDGRFRCEWHNATFNPERGKAESGPTASSLIRLPTRVEDGQLVYVYGE